MGRLLMTEITDVRHLFKFDKHPASIVESLQKSNDGAILKELSNNLQDFLCGIFDHDEFTAS
jgi:hypothetical protein